MLQHVRFTQSPDHGGSSAGQRKTLDRARADKRAESPQARRPENSCARRWTTFATASTAPARPSRPSRSACPRQGAPEWRSRLPRRGRLRRRRAAAPQRDNAAGAGAGRLPRGRDRGPLAALKREGSSAASRTALSRQAKASASKRGPVARSATARRAARTRSARRLRRIAPGLADISAQRAGARALEGGATPQ